MRMVTPGSPRRLTRPWRSTSTPGTARNASATVPVWTCRSLATLKLTRSGDAITSERVPVTTTSFDLSAGGAPGFGS